MNLSRKLYILSPRRVTLQPIFIPSRSLNAETDFFALVTTRFLTGDDAHIPGGILYCLGIVLDVADAHVEHDLSSFGTCIGDLYLNVC